MNISSVIVYARADTGDSVRQRLHALAGVEVHAGAPDGRLIVTMETDDAGASARIYEAIAQTEDVLSVALVYQRTDSEPDREF